MEQNGKTSGAMLSAYAAEWRATGGAQKGGARNRFHPPWGGERGIGCLGSEGSPRGHSRRGPGNPVGAAGGGGDEGIGSNGGAGRGVGFPTNGKKAWQGKGTDACSWGGGEGVKERRLA